VLGLTVTAEGVETAAQAQWLRSMDVEAGQGWHFGRPMAPEQFAVAVAADRTAGQPGDGST
jgi:sensor c-di-GMP phosphodiesterase-like protein